MALLLTGRPLTKLLHKQQKFSETKKNLTKVTWRCQYGAYVCQDCSTKDSRLLFVRCPSPEFQPLLGRMCGEMTDYCSIWSSCSYIAAISAVASAVHVPYNWLASFPRDQSHPVRALSICTAKTSYISLTTGTPAEENALSPVAQG